MEIFEALNSLYAAKPMAVYMLISMGLISICILTYYEWIVPRFKNKGKHPSNHNQQKNHT